MTQRATASEYAAAHKLDALLKAAANECYAANAQDPAQFLATYFQRKNMVDMIDSVSATEVPDGTGAAAALHIRVTLANGAVGTAITSQSSSLTSTNATVARIAIYSADKTKDSRYGDWGLQGALRCLNEKVAQALVGMSATNQARIDAAIKAADGTENFANLGSQVAAAVSLAVANAASASERQPLFLRIAMDYHATRGLPRALHIPTPVVSLFSCDPRNMGKARVLSVCIIPVVGPRFDLEAAIAASAKVLEAGLAKASGDGETPAAVHFDGAVRYSQFETLQQAADLAEECVKDAGFQPGADFKIGLVLDANYFFKPETQKYALIDGMEFSGAQLSEFLATLLKERPNVVYLEDTHVATDGSELRRLMSRAGESITLAGNNLYAGNIAAAKNGVDQKLTNNAVVRINDCGTVSGALSFATAFSQYSNATLTVAAELCEGSPACVADLAVAVGARYIRVGGLLRPDHAAVVARLILIKAEADQRGIYGPLPAFPAVELPPAPLEPVVEVTLKPDKKKK